MKLGWGHGIFATLTAFVLLMAWFMVRAIANQEELVAENYYEQEIGYQVQIDKQRNLTELGQDVVVSLDAHDLLIQLPAKHAGKAIHGSAVLFRPSDSRADNAFALVPDSSGRCAFDVTGALPGGYNLTVDWTVDSVDYQHTQPIHIP
jgi:hypothetical protein